MNKFLQTLGLCARSRKLISGEILYKKLSIVKLFVLATDASERTKKQIYKKAIYYNINVIEKYSSKEISEATSLNNRMVLGIIDEGFSQLLQNS